MKYSRIYVKLLRWAIFASLFLPLIIFKNYLSPFHFGKMVLFRGLVEIMAVFYILLIVANRRYFPRLFGRRSGWFTISSTFTIFTGFYLLTSLTAVDSHYALWGTLERMGGLFSFLHFWVFFLILISVFRNRVDWEKLLKVSVLVGFLSILFSFGQYFKLGNFFVGWQHGERIIGTIGNPALFAGYLLFVLFLALYFILSRTSSAKEKGLMASVFVLGVVALLLTAVRGSVIALFVGLLTLALFYIFFSKQTKQRRRILWGILIFLVLVVFVFLNHNHPWLKKISWLERITSISWKTTTVQTRLWAWQSGFEAWTERPLLGWGPENFVLAHSEHFNPLHFTGLGSETIWDRAHNVLLGTLTTMGLFGLFSYLAIFGAVLYSFWHGYRKKKLDKVTLAVFSSMILAYFIHNLFIFDTMANYFLFFLVLGYLHFRGQADQFAVEDEKIAHFEERNPSPFLITILVILALFPIYYLNIVPARANYTATRAILLGQKGEGAAALAKYQKALSFSSAQGKYEIRHKLATFVIQYTENLWQRKQQIDEVALRYAIKEVEKNRGEHPLDYIPDLYLGRLYVLLINQDAEAGEKAEYYANEALKINDKNPRIWYELGQARLSRKEFDSAIKAFQAALALNKTVKESNWYLGVAYFKAANEEESRKYVEKAIELGYAYKGSTKDLALLINLYGNLGDYQKVIALYKVAIKLKPKNAQFYASLATAYKMIGDKENAILYAQKAGEIDDSYLPGIKAFINTLK